MLLFFCPHTFPYLKFLNVCFESVLQIPAPYPPPIWTLLSKMLLNVSTSANFYSVCQFHLDGISLANFVKFFNSKLSLNEAAFNSVHPKR